MATLAELESRLEEIRKEIEKLRAVCPLEEGKPIEVWPMHLSETLDGWGGWVSIFAKSSGDWYVRIERSMGSKDEAIRKAREIIGKRVD